MTPRDLTLEALDFITDAATISGASAGQLRRIARDLSATMQEIYAAAPDLYKRRDGYRVADPQSITVTVAQGAISLTTSSTLIDGSTILIGGDATFNIVRIDGATKTLTLPYNGLSGTYTATVWNDSIPLGATVDRVTGNVLLNEQFPLDPRRNRNDALTRQIVEPDYGRRLRTVSNRRQPGQPDSYWVEAVMKTDGTAGSHESRLRLHLYPIPNRSYTIGYDVRVLAPQFAVADLGTDASDSTVPLVVGAKMQESIVRPLFIERWSGSPWFRNKEARKQIENDATSARALLAQYRPQQSGPIRVTAPL